MPPLRYHAFICHAPADNSEPGRKWAGWLREALENFPVPPGLAGRPTPVGPVPRSLAPVYCEALPLGSEGALAPETREALEQSRVLVVVCSPRAAQSREVWEEVRYFKQLGRERILAWIVDGDPEGSPSGSDSQPETLRFEVRRDGTIDREWRVHPVAADLRLDGSRAGYTSVAAYDEALQKEGVALPEARRRATDYGRTLDEARLKITAGVLGVPLPELTKRATPPGRPPRPGEPPDSYERAPGPPRRRGLGWIAPLFFLLLAGGAGWYAWQAEGKRQDAVDAQRRADNLIAWIQRDLGEKLGATGNVQLLAEVNERLIQYFQLTASRGEEAISTPALADALATAADIAFARAAYLPAVDLSRQALQMREKAVAARSSADELELRLLDDRRRLGRALEKAGRKTEALAEAEITRKKVAELVQRRTGEPGVLRLAMLADYESGDLLLASARAADAQQRFESGLEIARRLTTLEPGNVRHQQDAAEGTVKLGDVKLAKNEAAAALTQFQAALKILEPLAVANPELAEAQSALASIHSRVGGVLSVQRNAADAASEYRQALTIEEKLAVAQPTNLERQLACAYTLRRLAESLLQSGPENKLEALTLLQRALDYVNRNLPNPTHPRAMALRTEIERVKAEAMK